MTTLLIVLGCIVVYSTVAALIYEFLPQRLPLWGTVSWVDRFYFSVGWAFMPVILPIVAAAFTFVGGPHFLITRLRVAVQRRRAARKVPVAKVVER